ncbi:MAG TPA: hypothetical protein VFP71_09625 [Candidatus Angelobacter sp.]|nr:hypothetical protein [Candidatus Angelobacter sp.]
MYIRAIKGGLDCAGNQFNEEFILTLLNNGEFFDRSSFSQVVFEPDKLFWISNGQK